MMHHVEEYKRADGKGAWRITVGGNIVATDAGQGYENRKDLLDALFGIWFGVWDESFLALYQEWTGLGGGQYDIPEGMEEGVPVLTQPKPAPDNAPNYEADTPATEASDGA